MANAMHYFTRVTLTLFLLIGIISTAEGQSSRIQFLQKKMQNRIDAVMAEPDFVFWFAAASREHDGVLQHLQNRDDHIAIMIGLIRGDAALDRVLLDISTRINLNNSGGYPPSAEAVRKYQNKMYGELAPIIALRNRYADRYRTVASGVKVSAAVEDQPLADIEYEQLAIDPETYYSNEQVLRALLPIWIYGQELANAVRTGSDPEESEIIWNQLEKLENEFTTAYQQTKTKWQPIEKRLGQFFSNSDLHQRQIDTITSTAHAYLPKGEVDKIAEFAGSYVDLDFEKNHPEVLRFLRGQPPIPLYSSPGTEATIDDHSDKPATESRVFVKTVQPSRFWEIICNISDEIPEIDGYTDALEVAFSEGRKLFTKCESTNGRFPVNAIATSLALAVDNEIAYWRTVEEEMIKMDYWKGVAEVFSTADMAIDSNQDTQLRQLLEDARVIWSGGERQLPATQPLSLAADTNLDWSTRHVLAGQYFLGEFDDFTETIDEADYRSARDRLLGGLYWGLITDTARAGLTVSFHIQQFTDREFNLNADYATQLKNHLPYVVRFNVQQK